MAGISSKAMMPGSPENHKQFNGIEHTTDLDLNQYDAFFRTLDPQIGRFWQVDPKIDSMYAWSPYVAMFNNPLKFIDPLGDSSKPTPPPAYTPAPKTLPGFPDAGKRVYNPESGRYRWKLPDGSILEWDKQHGEVEKYDKSGKNHKGAYDPETGDPMKGPVPGRTTSKSVTNPLPSSSPNGYVNPGMPPISNRSIQDASKVATGALIIYGVVKLIELGIVVGTGGAAIPILAF